MIKRLVEEMSLVTDFDLLEVNIGRVERRKLDSLLALHKKLLRNEPSCEKHVKLSSETRFALCNYFYSIKDFSSAIEELEQIIRSQQSHVKAILCKSRIEESTGNLEEAAKTCDMILVRDPHNIPALTQKGIILTKLSRYHEAGTCLDAVLGADKNISFQGLDVPTPSSERDGLEAVESFSKIIKIDSGNIFARYNKGLICEEREDFDEAVACYDGILSLNPNHLPALCHRGISLLKLGHLDFAMDSFDRVLALKPKNKISLYHKGILLSAMGRRTEAITSFDRVLEIDPNHIPALYNRGLALESINKLEDAVDCYDRILQIDPNYGNILCHKGRLLSSVGRYTDAIACFDLALALNSSNTNALYYKSCAMLKDGKKDESLDLIEHMVSIDSKYKDLLKNEKDLEIFRTDRRFAELTN